MFVAVLPPVPVLEDLEEFLSPRQEAVVADRPLRWSAPGQWHVTLAFMPTVPEPAHDELVDGLAAAAAKRSPFEARLVGGGAFPDVAAGRVLWAGVEATEELDRLAVGARNATVRAGIEVDGQRFRPHVTLARAGRPLEMTRWIRVLDTYASPGWTVRELALVASHLGEGPRRRPRYEVLAELPLGG